MYPSQTVKKCSHCLSHTKVQPLSIFTTDTSTVRVESRRNESGRKSGIWSGSCVLVVRENEGHVKVLAEITTLPLSMLKVPDSVVSVVGEFTKGG